MGFPMLHSDLSLPRLFLHVFFLLGYVRRFVSCLFTTLGLGDLIDSDSVLPASGSGQPLDQHPEFRSVSAMLIQQLLPVVRYEDLDEGRAVAGECAVCLYEFEGGDEVRRLSNCRHVFHRCCLDRWMDHDQQTCPLCRTPLLPEDVMHDDGGDAFDGCVWAAAGIPDSYYTTDGDATEFSPFLPFLPHRLISSQ